jgi:hypothetical protein
MSALCLQLTTEQINKLIQMTDSTTVPAGGGHRSSPGLQYPELIGVWSNETGATRIQVQWWLQGKRYGKVRRERVSVCIYEWRQIGIDGTESDPWDWCVV